MKIVKLQAENIKRLVAVEISPAGNVVEITGKNGQGATMRRVNEMRRARNRADRGGDKDA